MSNSVIGDSRSVAGWGVCDPRPEAISSTSESVTMPVTENLGGKHPLSSL